MQMHEIDELVNHPSTDNHKAIADPHAKIKVIWAVVRPIIDVAKGLLFFKPKWQNTINDFEKAMDAVYGN